MTAPPPHRRRWDHLSHATSVQRFNRAVAIKVTAGVGSMWCAYAFCVVALIGLPTAWQQSFPRGGGFQPLPLVQWIAQTFLQLVLLSVIIVGQNIEAVASDARAGKTFDDAEESKAALMTTLDRLDCHTEGGLAEVLAAIGATRGDLAQVVAAVNGKLGGSA